MSVHEKPVGETVEWYTPPEVFDRLGVRFDTDPAMPHVGADWIPADWLIRDGHGLDYAWGGMVWLNPPYGPSLPAFVSKLIRHGNGVLLAPARTETRWFQRAATAAEIVSFARDRIHFIRQDGYRARASFGSVFMGFGLEAAAAVARANFGWTTWRQAER